jgi:hypothetical protein
MFAFGLWRVARRHWLYNGLGFYINSNEQDPAAPALPQLGRHPPKAEFQSVPRLPTQVAPLLLRVWKILESGTRMAYRLPDQTVFLPDKTFPLAACSVEEVEDEKVFLLHTPKRTF